MIAKQIKVDGIQQDTFEPQVILADGSIRGNLYNADGTGEILHNVVFIEWPFELTEDELLILKPNQNETT